MTATAAVSRVRVQGAAILAIVFALFPRALAYPVVAIFMWIGIALLYRGFKLRRERKRTSD